MGSPGNYRRIQFYHYRGYFANGLKINLSPGLLTKILPLSCFQAHTYTKTPARPKPQNLAYTPACRQAGIVSDLFSSNTYLYENHPGRTLTSSQGLHPCVGGACLRGEILVKKHHLIFQPLFCFQAHICRKTTKKRSAK